MKRFNRILVSAFFLSVLVGAGAQQAPSPEAPAWLYLKLGEKAFREGEFGDALLNFRNALKRKEAYPEAETGIGRVFQEEGEYGLAETHFLKAAGQRSLFAVPDDYFEVLYLLSEIYRTQRKHRDYEDTLLTILSHDEYRTVPEKKALLDAMVRVIHERGLEKAVELYRLPVDFTLRAYRDLGVFYYETGRYVRAVEHLTIASVKIFSAVLEEQKKMDPDYTYRSIGQVLETASLAISTRDFIHAQELYRVLYYLGASLYAETRSTSVKSIWAVFMNRKEAGIWASRARDQYQNPFIEPVVAQ